MEEVLLHQLGRGEPHTENMLILFGVLEKNDHF